MKKITIILEDNPAKLSTILDLYEKDFFHNPVLCFRSEHHARFVIESVVQFGKQTLPIFTLYLDDELVPGGGYGSTFLNWMIDNYPTAIEKVIVTSFRDRARKEMVELCAENLIATDLMPLPFAAGSR